MADAASLSVRGTATLEIPPDFGFIALAITDRNRDRDVALSSVRSKLETLRASLAAAEGVRKAEFPGVSVNEYGQWDEPTQSHINGGWMASLSGNVESAVDVVGSVVMMAIAAGAHVWLDWKIEDDNPGYREVRRRAVADAARAAEDFADALGRSVGHLVALADPGLLAPHGPTRALPAFARQLGSGPLRNEPDLDVDPRPVILQASVEARYILED
jgi:uncharacterized protein